MTRGPADRRLALVVVAFLAAGASPAVGLAGGAAARAVARAAARSERPDAPGTAASGARRGRSSAAGDESVSGPAFAELVRRAASDPAALARLRLVRAVDGRPVDVAAALAGAGPAPLAGRLEALAAIAGSPAGGARSSEPGVAAAARRDAAQVLAGRKYHPRQVPRPLHGVLAWLGDRLDPLFGPIGRLVARLGDTVAGLVALAVALLAATILAARRLIIGRSRAAVIRRAEHGLVVLGLDPTEVERRAAAAEASGDHREAVRLHYQAGLLRLHLAGRIVLRPDTTAAAVAAQLPSPDLDQLTVDFEEIVYGGRPAETADEVVARQRWAAVLTARAEQ